MSDSGTGVSDSGTGVWDAGCVGQDCGIVVWGRCFGQVGMWDI